MDIWDRVTYVSHSGYTWHGRYTGSNGYGESRVLINDGNEVWVGDAMLTVVVDRMFCHYYRTYTAPAKLWEVEREYDGSLFVTIADAVDIWRSSFATYRLDTDGTITLYGKCI